MTEIKDKELQEFWEWCGIRYEPDQDCFKVIFPDGEWYNFGSDWKIGKIEPELNLNNLFKYAVPKFGSTVSIVEIIFFPAWRSKPWTCAIGYCPDLVEGEYIEPIDTTGRGKSSTQALYQAIQKARKVNDDRDQ